MDNILDVLQGIETAAAGWVLQAFVRMQSMILGQGGWLPALLILFFVLWGYGLWSGRVEINARDGFSRLFLVILVIVGATNVGFFLQVLYPFFMNAPDTVANVVMGGAGTDDLRETMDRTFLEGLQAGSDIWEQGDTFNMGPQALAILVWTATFLFLGYACFLLILSKVATAVLLALAPLAFLALLFSFTRPIFEKWIGLLFNFWFIPIVTFLAVSFMIGLAEQCAQEITEKSSMGLAISFGVIAPFLLVALIAFLFLLQITNITASLGGGVALSTVGGVSYVIQKINNRLNPPSRRYVGGGREFEGRTRTVMRDVARARQSISLRAREPKR